MYQCHIDECIDVTDVNVSIAPVWSTSAESAAEVWTKPNIE